VNELSLIRKIRRLKGARGIGDDCAVIPMTSGNALLTTDLLIEGVHFERETHKASDVGWKALARGLSDIAAMGGEPRQCLVSLALAPWNIARWVDGFYRGLLALAQRERVALVGGDVSRAPQFVCDIVVVGTVPSGAQLLRSGARPQDAIYVSGELGGAGLGLARRAGRAWRRHVRPEPRVALGKFLRGRATAAMDVSDGLALDLHRLCLESGVSAELEGPLPLFPGATRAQGLGGGDDYELLFTAPLSTPIPARLRGLRLTRIGRIRQGKPGSLSDEGRPLRITGWDPFSRP
jgi:thiamine-monophosphate kinase